MEKLDVHQPIKTTFDGSNYVIWSQEMTSFLKGRRLWRYATGDIIEPAKAKDEDDTSYANRLEDWDSKNHQILTWIRNTCVPSIKIQFGRFETAQSVWDFLATRYSVTDIAHQYQLLETLTTMKQTPEQSINEFLAQMHSIWDKLALAEPQWTSSKDAQSFFAYRDKMRVMQFLMALDNSYEPLRGPLLHRENFQTLEIAVAELLSEETRLHMLKPQSLGQVPNIDTVMAVSPSSSEINCRYCKRDRHLISECRKLRGRRNNTQNYPHQSKPNWRASAVTPDETPPSISLADLQAFIEQVNLNNNSTSALSITPTSAV